MLEITYLTLGVIVLVVALASAYVGRESLRTEFAERERGLRADLAAMSTSAVKLEAELETERQRAELFKKQYESLGDPSAQLAALEAEVVAERARANRYFETIDKARLAKEEWGSMYHDAIARYGASQELMLREIYDLSRALGRPPRPIFLAAINTLALHEGESGVTEVAPATDVPAAEPAGEPQA